MSLAAWTLRGVSAGYEDREIFQDLSVTIRQDARTVVLGPGGSGKTTFLRLLCPQCTAHPPWVRGDIERPDCDPIWVPQQRLETRAPEAKAATLSGRLADLERALEAEGQILALDEPVDRFPPEERRAFADRLLGATRGRTLVVVTHDLLFARLVADDVILFAAGEMIEASPADRFFDLPRSERGRSFLRSGS